MSISVLRVMKATGLAVGFTVVVAALILWLAGYFHPKIAADGEAQPLSRPLPEGAVTAAARLISTPRTETAVGAVRAVRETTLASRILARVVEVNAVAGQMVKQGDVLVRLDDEDLRSQLQQAEAAVSVAQAGCDQAQIEYDRIQRLAEQNNASTIEVDRTTQALRAAKGELERAVRTKELAQTRLDYAVIRSPADGKVVDKLIDVGDTVSPGTPLVKMYDPTQMQLVANVRESLTRRLAVGQDVGVKLDVLPAPCRGLVSEIVPTAQAASRTFEVKVTGPCPEGVYPGMFGRLLIPLDNEQVTVVPWAAVRHIGQLNVVDVVKTEGGRDVLSRRTITLGKGYGDDVEVLSGLAPGERVVLAQSEGAAHE